MRSALAAADPDVKGRAIEGLAFAKEGKGDLDGALASFKELSGIDVKGYKELATYHEARVLLAQGREGQGEGAAQAARRQAPAPEPGAAADRVPEELGARAARVDRSLDADRGAGRARRRRDANARDAPGHGAEGAGERAEEGRRAAAGRHALMERAVKSRSRFFLGGATIALAMSLVACEKLSIPATPEVPMWLHHPGGALSVSYRKPLTAESRQVGEAYERGQPEIDVVNKRIFVGSSDHGLYALRAEDGETFWRFETPGPVQCEPLYDPDEDVVYFGSNDGALYKVDASNGRLLWRFATNAEVTRRPVLRNGVLYVMNANDTLIAMNAATGELKWHQHRTPAFGMEIAGYAGPALGRDKVYTAFSDGVVLAYDIEDGSEQWPLVDLAAEAEQTNGGDAPRYLDVDTTPIVSRISSGDVVFVGSYAGGVFALDAENGTRAWVNEKATGVTELVLWEQPAHKPSKGPLPSVPAQRILFASSGLTGLWALDPNDGRTLWRRNLPEGGMTAPVPVAGALLVGTTRYGLFLFSPVTGGAHRRDPAGRQLRDDAGSVRGAGVRALQRRRISRGPGRAAVEGAAGPVDLVRRQGLRGFVPQA